MKAKNWIMFLWLGGLLLPGTLQAQRRMPAQEQEVPLIRPEEQRVVDRQEADFALAIEPALERASQSAVRIWSGRRRLAYGTAIASDRVLTKWSEVAPYMEDLRIEAGDGVARAVTVSGVYYEDDLAVLTVFGDELVPIQWSREPLKLGQILAAPQPDGRPAGVGVVSVLSRNLRETDQPFLGIAGDMDFKGPGVKVAQVEPETGAAQAGIVQGDVILQIAGRAVSTLTELKSSLVGYVPGSKVDVVVLRGEEQRRIEVVLGNRPHSSPSFSGARLAQMERMGGQISEVRDLFSQVVQTDMRMNPNQIGGPVADLNGNVIGISLARADRTRSFIMPSGAVEDLLKQAPSMPEAIQETPVEAADQSMPNFADLLRRLERRGRSGMSEQERLGRHLGDMQRLLKRMDEEMDALEDEQ